MKKLLLLSAIFAFFCGQAPAQSVPALINYQGQLTDANGTNLATADYMLTFNLYDVPSGGLPVWGPQVFDGASSQGHGPKIPVVQGYFNVLLGSNDTTGRSLAEAFNGAARYVEIKVGANNPITPRQQILSAPFALKANSAEKLVVPGGSAVAAVIVNSNGNVGVGTSSARVGLEVQGKSYIFGGLAGLNNPDPNPTLTVEGAPDQSNGRLMYLRGSWVNWHSDRYFMMGFDGNGVNKFLIRGNGMVEAAGFQGDGSQLTGVAPATGSPAYVAKAGDTMTGALHLPANGLSVADSQLSLSSGNVGIGTTSPGYPLTVRRPPASGDMISWGNTSKELGRLGYSANADGGWVGLINPGGSWGVHIDSAGPSWINGGNVGIGTSNPRQLLEVSGKAIIEGPLRRPSVPGDIGATLTVLGNSDASDGRLVYFDAPWDSTYMTDRWFLRCYDSTGVAKFAIRGDGATFGSSSQSQKTNIIKVSNSLGTLNRIQGVSYTWIGDQHSTKPNLGFIAEDLAEVLPEAISEDGKMVNYSAVTPVLVEGVKELHHLVKTQQAELAAKDQEIQSLSQRLAAVEAAVLGNSGQKAGGSR